jgi:hypothetical protein
MVNDVYPPRLRRADVIPLGAKTQAPAVSRPLAPTRNYM